MAPRWCFSAPVTVSTLLLLLLFLITTLHQFQVDAAFVLTSTPAMKVPVEKQLNASQAFVKT